MRILINTPVGDNNYGNRLQNFALQQILTDCGNDVKTLDRRPLLEKKGGLLSKVSEGLRDHTLKYKIHVALNGKIKRQRTDMKVLHPDLTEFSKTHIDFFELKDSLREIDKAFDLVVTGSDQVWNYTFWDGAEVEFARGVNIPKIAYAASIGVNSLPDGVARIYKQELRDYKSISMREQSGAKLVSDLLQREIPVVLDPTMLLKPLQWKTLMSNEDVYEQYSKDVLLAVFLTPPDESTMDEIRSVAREKDLTVVYLSEEIARHNVEIPSFLRHIQNAELIVTDSFHVTVFSILFEKHFITKPRNGFSGSRNMSSRVYTLLASLGIDEDSTSSLSTVEYAAIHDRMRVQRKRSLNILEEMVSNCDSNK